MTDSLAIYALFAKLDSALNTDGLTPIADILKASSSVATDSLESALAAIGKIYDKKYAANSTNREDFYTHLFEVQAANGTGTIVTLADKPAFTIAALAQSGGADGYAYAYALKELNPFAVLGADYSSFNTNGALDLYDPATDQGQLSESWFTDRAAMLTWKLKLNAEDFVYIEANPYHCDEDAYFKDYESNTVISLQNNAMFKREILFGSNAGETLNGRVEDDRLYGQGGHDVLNGGGGADYLEGGAGEDRLNGGGGNDELQGGKDNDQLMGEAGADTLIGGAGQDTLDGGDGADVLHGDLQNPDDTTVAVTDTLKGGKGDDTLYGGGGDDSLDGGDGADVLHGNAGNDSMQGGADDDQLNGGEGNDTLKGESGEDTLIGNAGDDRLDGGDHNDILLGGEGNDTLIGGEGRDQLLGGDGNDTYQAGNGDTIVDSDRQGAVYLNDRLLSKATRKKGEAFYKDSAGNSYLLRGENLSINGTLGIKNYSNGDLGITLEEKDCPRSRMPPKSTTISATHKRPPSRSAATR